MWHYITFEEDDDGDIEPVENIDHWNDKNVPPRCTAFLGYDVADNAVVLAYRESGGYCSKLSPNVNDDCNIIAWAPLNEISAPDYEEMKAHLCPEFDYTIEEFLSGKCRINLLHDTLGVKAK